MSISRDDKIKEMKQFMNLNPEERKEYIDVYVDPDDRKLLMEVMLEVYKKQIFEMNRTSLTDQDKELFALDLKQITQAILNCYAYFPDENQLELMSMIIQDANAILLQDLLIDERNKEKEVQFLEKFTHLKKEERDYGEFLLSLTKETDKWFITSLITGYSFLPLEITFQGGLLTCAQVADRKSKFKPVLLRDIDEFSNYLTTLKNITPPCQDRFRFIITGSHWIAGDIEIDVDGHASILFMESLGFKGMSSTACDAIKEAEKIFGKETSVYVPDLKRQRDNISCMLFGLVDVRNLFTVNEHLIDEFKHSGLHGFLRDSAEQLANKGICPGCVCDLFLKSNPKPGNVYKTSDDYHLYLYKDVKGFYYRIKGNRDNQYLHDEENKDELLHAQLLNATFSEDEKPCVNKNICDAVLKITSIKRGYTKYSHHSM